jgi:hypothetical protein
VLDSQDENDGMSDAMLEDALSGEEDSGDAAWSEGHMRQLQVGGNGNG